MKRKYYNIGLSVLCVLAVFLIILKMYSIEEDQEVNYIGELEEKEDATEELEEENVLLEISNMIRVLIKDSGYNNITHDCLEVSCESGLYIEYETEIVLIEANERFYIEGEACENQLILITPIDKDDKIIVHSLERGYGEPEYAGTLNVYVEDGVLVLVNELELEEYLQGVLPSEMPASYELEALKAQAVCARSYAYTYMTQYAYPEYEAHVDDSTSYQVYNNLLESDTCNQAIEDTSGQKVWVDGEVITTYFFSTSSGETTDVIAWGRETTDGYEYLEGISVCDDEGIDYEAELSWYSWSVTMDSDTMEDILQENIVDDFGNLTSIKVTEYGTGDVALVLEINGSKETIEIVGEYDIRSVLGSTSYTIDRQDGSEV